MFRPNLVYNMGKLKKEKILSQEIVDMVLFLCLYAVENMFIKGQVQNVNFILDISKLGILQFPIKILKSCLKSLKGNFNCVQYKSFLINTSGGLNTIWSLLSPIMPKVAREKTTLSQSIICEELIK